MPFEPLSSTVRPLWQKDVPVCAASFRWRPCCFRPPAVAIGSMGTRYSVRAHLHATKPQTSAWRHVLMLRAPRRMRPLLWECTAVLTVLAKLVVRHAAKGQCSFTLRDRPKYGAFALSAVCSAWHRTRGGKCKPALYSRGIESYRSWLQRRPLAPAFISGRER